MNERYELLCPIAEGGLGTVFRARDRQTGHEVAVKRTRADKADAAAVQALLQEAALQSRLHHPGIATVLGSGSDAEGAYLVLELLPGESLEEALARAPLAAADFDALVRQVLAAVAAIHAEGLLHLDLKPGNLMLHRAPGGGLQVKIIDFGLAVPLSPEHAAPAPVGLPGSVFFMAPEQFRKEPLDARSDLYALGCVFYYALTQRHPFEGELSPQVVVAHLHHRTQPLASLRPDLPAHITRWVEWLMRRQPTQRPASAADALQVYAAGAAGVVPPAE
jgi:serine/threonine protein kinase